jgi:hypothetical protein
MVSAYAAAALFVFATWVWGADTEMQAINGDPRSTLDGLIYGTAYNPFVQRALVPLLTRAGIEVIPAGARDSLRNRLASIPKFQKEARRLGWDLRFVPEYLIAFFFSFLALLYFPFVLRSLFATLYAVEDRLLSLVPLAALFVLPPFFFIGTHYVYDFPALLFFTLGLLLMVRRRWAVYYLVFMIGCINKETMVLLLIPLLLIYRTAFPRRQMLVHAALHVILFGAVKGSLMLIFAGNPGGVLEFHLFGNIHKLLMPYSLLTMMSAAIVALMIWFDFPAKHPVLRKAAWLLVPFLLLTLCFAWIDEGRDFYELFPIFILLMAHTVLFSFMKRPYALKNVVAS